MAGALFEGLGLALIAPMLAILFRNGQNGGTLRRVLDALFRWFGAETVWVRLALLLAIFVAAMALRAVVLLARDVTLGRLRIGFLERQRTRIAEALAAASWDQVARLRHARIVHVMGGDMQQIGGATQFLTQSITALPMLAVQCALAFYLSPPLAILALALLVCSAWGLYPMMTRAKQLGSAWIEANQDLLHGTAQLLGGLKLAISQNLQTAFLAEFRATLERQKRQQISYLRRQAESRLIIATLSALVGAALVLLGLAAFQIPAATLVALLLVVTRMSGPAGQIQQGAQMVANALPAYETVLSLVHELEAAAPLPAKVRAVPRVLGEIRFAKVTFFHPQDGASEEHGVRDLSLAIEPGICLGIKGASGAGKTTFADLLAGLYAPQSGSITVGGELLAGDILNQWRDRISYVAQDPFLFHDTIRRNLGWANAGADEAAMWQALELVEAAGFVRSMPGGLDTVVGERGTLVSGGERQRLALARALLRRPELLILDEATNALDPSTEQTIFERLAAQSPRPTIVIIAHRPESLSRCDRVVEVKDGRMVEL